LRSKSRPGYSDSPDEPILLSMWLRNLMLKALLCSVWCSVLLGAAVKERLALEPKVQAELTAVLVAGDTLHSALTKQDDEQVDLALRDMEHALNKSMAATGTLKEYQRTHLMKLLEATQEFVEVARNSSHMDRRARLVDIFNNLANFVRIYNVDARFKIFFCGRDRLTWVQTSPRGQHPMPESLRDPASDRMDRDCAIRAP